MPARSRGSLRKRTAKSEESSAGAPTSTSSPEVVYEGRIYHRGKLVSAEIGTDDNGIIVAVAKALRGGERKSFGDAVLLPSAIDLHAHFRDPGPPGEVENFDSGTTQAALGGVGTVVDMPNTLPPTTTVERLKEKIDLIHAHAWVDVLPYAALMPGARVEKLARVASGFKLYMAPTTGDLAIGPETEMPELFTRVSSTGLPLHVHAEDPLKFHAGPAPASTEDWDHARSMDSELSAIGKLALHPSELRLHVAHATAVDALHKAIEIGASVEATPHHLLLSASTFGGPLNKVNPPLRPESVRNALWEEFKKGAIPILASDHAPHSLSKKSLPFSEAPSGVPGIETMIPLMLERVRLQDLPISTFVNVTSRHPALFLGINRGRLEKGCEANFIVVDFRKRKHVHASELHAPCGWTPFEGWDAIFPEEHYLRGNRMVEGGEFVGGSKGQTVRPILGRAPTNL
jgi:dihydroorotase